MLEDKVCGTYWLCNTHGNLYLVQGNKPILLPDGYFEANFDNRRSEMGWLCLSDKSSYAYKTHGVKVTSADFKDLEFPITSPGDIIRITISKSGKIQLV